MSEKIGVDVDSILEKYMDGCWQRLYFKKSLKVGYPIYHYTSSDGLKGIIDSKIMKVSHCDFLNDETEIKYFSTIFDEAITSLIYTITDVAEKEAICNLKTEYQSYFAERQQIADIFIASFSKKRDSLSLWAMYTQNIGHSMEINQDFFFDIHRGLKSFSSRLGSVFYDPNCQKKIIYNECKEWLKNWRRINTYGGGDIEGIKKDFINAYCYNMYWLSMFFKNPAFSCEEEVRLVIDNVNNARVTGTKAVRNCEIEFRTKNNLLIPYINLSININGILAIGLGPKNNNNACEQAIKLYMNKIGINGSIYKSDIPLR